MAHQQLAVRSLEALVVAHQQEPVRRIRIATMKGLQLKLLHADANRSRKRNDVSVLHHHTTSTAHQS